MAMPSVNSPIDLTSTRNMTVDLNETEKLHFKYLPAYAQFILDHQLEEFTIKMLQFSREVDLPLLRLFKSYSEEELLRTGMQSIKESLTFFAANKANELIDHSMKAWLNNELPAVSRDSIVAEDITLVSFVRRKVFRELVHFYTNDFAMFRYIMEEVDEFTTQLESVSFNLLLNRQQSLYKQAQSLAHIGNWVWDLKANKLMWSEELYRIYELAPGTEITNVLIASYNHPDDSAYVHEQMQISAETLKPHDFYYRIILKNGKEKVLHAKGEVVVDNTNKPIQFFGTLQDVTEQKRFEKELQEKQSFIQTIADITPSLIAAYNINTGKYIFINKALKKLLGYEPEEVFEKGVEFFMELIHPDDLNSLLKKNAEALQHANNGSNKNADNEVIAEFQYRLRHKSGEYRWFHTYGTIFSRDKEGKVEYVLNISVDVTQQYLLSKQLEQEKIVAQKNTEELRRSEERYQKMITEVEDYAILLLDKEGNIQNWNLGAEKIKGYKADEIIGKNFRVFYMPEDKANSKPDRLLRTAIETGKATDEGWRVRKDGTRFWGSTVITALHDNSNNIIGFSKVTRDLTERKIAEEKMKKYAEELEQKNEELVRTNKELESFNYVASHDLQEPLRKIQIFSNAVLSTDFELLSEKGKEYFHRMFSAANRMQQLIEDLLAFSRTSVANAEFELADLNELLNEVISIMRLSIDESHATIEAADLPSACVIPFQFRQVFQNLISNSIKYSKPGVPPHIKISSELITAKSQRGLKANTQYHKIIFSDNGIGFDQMHADKIFELFQRLHTKEEFPGTGIGLAICKKIIQNHHGVIKAKGIPRKGSTFEIFIPAST